jgi:hypothetical protein
MTSMEKETDNTYSVLDVAKALEKLALDRIIDLRMTHERQPINI